MWNLKKKKKIQMNLFTKQKQTYRYQKQTYGYQRGNLGWQDKLGVQDCYTHTRMHRIENQQGTII